MLKRLAPKLAVQAAYSVWKIFGADRSWPTTLYPVRSIRTCRDRSARISASFRHGFYPDTDPVFLGIPPAERLNMIPSSAPPFFQIHKSHGIGYGMNSVGTAAIKKLEVICDGRGEKRGLSGSGGLCPFLWERPSADQVNNTFSVPLSSTLTATLNLCGNRVTYLTLI